MRRLFFVLIFIVFISCDVYDKKSLENTEVLDNFETYFLNNEVADDDMIISVNGFIDSLNDADANRYYLLSESHRFLGYCHYTKCNFNIAIKEYISALKFSDKVKDNQNLKGDIYKNIADVFYDCENYTLAKELYFKSLDYCLNSLDSNNIVHDYRRIGNICYYLSENENPDTLQYYMQKSMNFAKNEEPLISALYMALTAAFHQKEKLEGLSPNRMKGISLLPDNRIAMNYSLNSYLSVLYQIEGDIDGAIKHSIIALGSDNMIKQMSAHKQLSDLYLINGDTISSVYHDIKYDSINDILSEYKRAASAAENLLHEYEKESQNVVNKNGDSYFIFMISTLIIITTLSFLILIKKKRRTVSKEYFSERWERLTLSDIFLSIKDKCENESDLSAVNVSASMICLKENEKMNLEKMINLCFNNFVDELRKTFPELNKGEIDYCMISLLNISEIHKAALLGLSYQGCVSRRKRVVEKTKMSNINEDLMSFLQKHNDNII
ncbi:MAG: hypothetical protein IJE47_11065 [Bacteroidales bacterium]|nr:hypothetical protein [Bacteroidales bacterium]